MNIPALIAAIAFAILVFFLALPLWKLGQVFDRLRDTIDSVGENTNATIVEASKTVQGANSQLEKIDAVTTSAAQIAQDASAMSTLMTSTLAKPFIKVAAFSVATRSVFRSQKGNDENSH